MDLTEIIKKKQCQIIKHCRFCWFGGRGTTECFMESLDTVFTSTWHNL